MNGRMHEPNNASFVSVSEDLFAAYSGIPGLRGDFFIALTAWLTSCKHCS